MKLKRKLITPKKFKANCKIALKKAKEELVKFILEEQEREEEKNQLIKNVGYWENMLK